MGHFWGHFGEEIGEEIGAEIGTEGVTFPGEIFRGGGEESGRHRKRCRPHEGGRVLLKFRGGLLRVFHKILSFFDVVFPLAKGFFLR